MGSVTTAPMALRRRHEHEGSQAKAPVNLMRAGAHRMDDSMARWWEVVCAVAFCGDDDDAAAVGDALVVLQLHESKGVVRHDENQRESGRWWRSPRES
jgi:hypothetical protein